MTKNPAHFAAMLAQACWYSDVSRTALLAMPSALLADFAKSHGLTRDQTIIALGEISRVCHAQASAVRQYRDSHGHA